MKKKHLWFFLVFLSITFALASCKPKPPDCTAGKSNRTEGCDQFKRVNSTVYKGMSTASSLPPFTQSGWHPIKTGEAVSTNNSGMAELNFSDCWPGKLFCFKDSSFVFQVATCGQVAYEQNPAACLPNGSIYTTGSCPGEYIKTGSARVKKIGTALSITYLPDRRNVTLVIVLEGSAEVEPVLNIDPLQLGGPDTVESGLFYFTMPDDQLAPIGGLQPRQPYPIPELPPVVAELDIWEWMFDVRDQAENDDVLPGDWPPDLTREGGGPQQPQPGTQSFSFNWGGPLLESLIQEAMLQAVNWADIAAVTGVDISQLSGGGVNNFPVFAANDPDLSRQLLAEAGVPDGLGVTILYPFGDPELAGIAEMIQQFLVEGGFDAVIQESDPDLATQLAMLEEAGEAYFILER